MRGLHNGEGQSGTPRATFSGFQDLWVRELHDEPHVQNMLSGVVEHCDDPAVGGRGDEVGMPNLKGVALHGADHKGNKRLLTHLLSSPVVSQIIRPGRARSGCQTPRFQPASQIIEDSLPAQFVERLVEHLRIERKGLVAGSHKVEKLMSRGG